MIAPPSKEDLERQRAFLLEMYGPGEGFRRSIDLIVASLEELRGRIERRGRRLAAFEATIADVPTPEQAATLERLAEADRRDMKVLGDNLKGITAAQTMLGGGPSGEPGSLTYEDFVRRSYDELKEKAERLAARVVAS